MKRRRIAVIVVAIVVVLCAAGLIFWRSGGSGGQQGGQLNGQMPQQEVAYTMVKGTNPYIADVSVTSSLTGTIEASDVVDVYAKASGDVTAVYVMAGDYVTPGQVLCEIDTEQVESARNSMESAQVQYEQAQSTLNRMAILYAGGDLSEQDYEQYQNNVTSTRLSYEAAKLNYDRQVEYSSITAPIGGRIETCDVEVYDHVSQNEQLCVISGESGSRIVFYVSQRMLNNLNLGDEVQVVKNGKDYTGWISEISTMVDSATGLFKIKAELENTDEIAIGSSVKIVFVSDRSNGVMCIPVDAIYYSGGNAYIYLYEDGIAHMRSVEVGLYDDENAEILSGLSMSDMVISTWSSNLYEGANIRLMGAEESAVSEREHDDGEERLLEEELIPDEIPAVEDGVGDVQDADLQADEALQDAMEEAEAAE